MINPTTQTTIFAVAGAPRAYSGMKLTHVPSGLGSDLTNSIQIRRPPLE